MPPKRKNDAGPAKQVPKKRRRLSAGSSSFHGRGRADENYQPRQTRAQAALGEGPPLLFLDDNSVPRVVRQQAPHPAVARVVHAADSSAESNIQEASQHGDEEDATPPLSPNERRRRIRSGAPSPADPRPQPDLNAMFNPDFSFEPRAMADITPPPTNEPPRPNNPQPCSRCKPTCGGIYGCLYYSDDSPSSSSSGSGTPSTAVGGSSPSEPGTPPAVAGSHPSSESGTPSVAVERHSSSGSTTAVDSPFSTDATTLVGTDSNDELEMSNSSSGSDEGLSGSSSQSPEHSEEQQSNGYYGLQPRWLARGSWATSSPAEDAPGNRPNNNNPPSIPHQPGSPRSPQIRPASPDYSPNSDFARNAGSQHHHPNNNTPPDYVPFGRQSPHIRPSSPDYSPNSDYAHDVNARYSPLNLNSPPFIRQQPGASPPPSTWPTSSESSPSPSNAPSSDTDPDAAAVSLLLDADVDGKNHNNNNSESLSSGREQADYPDSEDQDNSNNTTGAGESDPAMLDYRGREEAQMDALLDRVEAEALEEGEIEIDYYADQEGDSGDVDDGDEDSGDEVSV